jgi:hypothetical protein
MKRFALLIVLLVLSGLSSAASPWSGNWVFRDNAVRMTMTIVEAGGGWKVTWKVPVPSPKGGAVTYSTMTMETKLDGKDAPNFLDGKPSGQSMEIRKVDDRHTYAVMKYQGKPTGISKSEISPDGKVIKSENSYDVASPNGAAGKQVVYWDKQ